MHHNSQINNNPNKFSPEKVFVYTVTTDFYVYVMNQRILYGKQYFAVVVYTIVVFIVHNNYKHTHTHTHISPALVKENHSSIPHENINFLLMLMQSFLANAAL